MENHSPRLGDRNRYPTGNARGLLNSAAKRIRRPDDRTLVFDAAENLPCRSPIDVGELVEHLGCSHGDIGTFTVQTYSTIHVGRVKSWVVRERTRCAPTPELRYNHCTDGGKPSRRRPVVAFCPRRGHWRRSVVVFR